jgi:hypothetical protein
MISRIDHSVPQKSHASGHMELAPFSQVMEREAKPKVTGKAGGKPAFPEPKVQSQEEALKWGQVFWAKYLKDKAQNPVDGQIFFTPEKMYSLMRQGSDGSPAPVRLLRLSWLLEQARRGAVLSRRQELPEEAFLSEAEVRALPRGHMGRECETCFVCCMSNDDKPLHIMSISHGWLTPEHPDPFGEQLARFAKQIERERQFFSEKNCLEAGAFWCCCCGIVQGYCCWVFPTHGQRCGESAQQLPSGEFGVFYE